MMARSKLYYLFTKLRNSLIKSGKFEKLSQEVTRVLENSGYFNKNKTIVLFNSENSLVFKQLLLKPEIYFKNTFVYPKIMGDSVRFFLINDPNILILDDFGIKDISSEAFQVDINNIDVILVSGIAFDCDGNWLHSHDNSMLYRSFLGNTNADKLGVCVSHQVYKKELPESLYKVDGLLTEHGIYYPVDMGDL